MKQCLILIIAVIGAGMYLNFFSIKNVFTDKTKNNQLNLKRKKKIANIRNKTSN